MNNVVKISIPDLVGDLAAEVEGIIRQHAPDGSVDIETYNAEPANTDEWIERTKDAHGVVLGWSIPDEALEAATQLKALTFFGTGIADQVSLPICEARGIRAYNVTGYGNNAVAEHTMALIFAAWHQVPALNNAVHAGNWPEVERREMRGSSLGIVGYGGIGKRVAELASGMGMDVRVWSRSLTPGTDIPHGTVHTLEEVLAESDALSVHLALNPKTHNFINATTFQAMKPGVVFVNTARGDIVDTDALVSALDQGIVATAAVDVFTSEPVSQDNPLLGMNNAILTPHIAYNTVNAVKSLTEFGTMNLVRHFWPDTQ